MQIYVFGNEDLEMDSLPLKILPELKKLFPEIDFVTKDPNEDWDDVGDITIIDTVVGITDVKVFDTLKDFIRAPRFSLHDFDAYTNLLMLEKLGKIKKVTIIGISPSIPQQKTIEEIEDIIKNEALNL